MSNVSVIHKSFVIDRVYPTSIDRVFRAFTDPKKKRRWFAEGEGFIVDSYSLDFSVGGFERTRFRFGDGPAMTNDCVYLDIAPSQRIVFAYSMTIGDAPMSSSLGCIEFVNVDGGTRLSLTEHTAYVDGNDGSEGRRAGTLELLESLALELQRAD
jgi:uncharacterized protein YndB with AHSA1/START domain